MKPVGKVRKKKDKKEVTCYHYWEKRHYAHKYSKKIVTQSFIVEVPLGRESAEEEYLELTKNILITKEVSDESESNRMRENQDMVLVSWRVRSINNI
jgi:hypothetical protein